MPIYEYKCEKCDATFEAMQSVSAKPLKTCNGMGCNDKENGKVHRLVSASGFILKGSGWYTSDYPSEARKKGWESESQQTSNTTNTSNSDSDSGNKTPSPASQVPTSEKAATKPAPKKPAQKNPYSGSNKPRTKNFK